MWQFFTQHAKRAVFLAQEETARLGTTDVDLGHLLLGLLRRRDCGAARVLERLGVPRGPIRREIDQLLPRDQGPLRPENQLTPDAKRAVNLAHEEAQGLGSETIGTVHLLLGLIGEGESPPARLFADRGATAERVRDTIRGLQDESPALDAEEASTTWFWVLPHPRTARILLLEKDGKWSLPTLEHENGWFPNEAGGVARQVGEKLGIPVTALRHLHEGDEGESQIGELESHEPEWPPPENGRWLDETEIADLALAEPSHRDALHTWFSEANTGSVPLLRPPWERPGWLAKASRWIRAQMEQTGIRVTAPITQFKTAWSGSCILRAATTAGDLYFKAVGAQPPSEPALLAELATRWPQVLPTILAMDTARRWILMRDFGGRPLEAEGPEEAAAARRFAEIQVEASTDVPRWLGLGCPDRRLERMPALQTALLADGAALQPEERDGLTEMEICRLRELAPRFREMWQELQSYAVPSSIVQQDFREGHVIMTAVGPLFFDWSDTVVSHPFFSVICYLQFLPMSSEPEHERGRRIRDAYLEPWTAFEPRERLIEAFDLARALNPLYQAIRWYLALPYAEPGCPWCVTIARCVPQDLRTALRSTAP